MNILQKWHNSIREGTSPHAVLLCGAQDANQAQLARTAAAIYCCGSEDIGCLNNNPRYLEIGPMAVGALRDALNSFCMLGTSDGRRAFVLLDAHLCNPPSQNALLKTIEEPPSDTLFILTGNETGFLPTIRSRCTILRIGSQPIEQVQHELIETGVEKQLARLCALLSDGNFNRAARYAADEYQQFRASAIPLIEQILFAVTPYSKLTALMTRPDESGKKRVSAQALADFLDIWLSLLRDALVLLRQSDDVRNFDRAALINKISSCFTIGQIQGMISITLDAERMQTFQTSAAMTLDWVLAQCKG